MFQDLRYAARALRASPGLVAVAVLSLGLGIGVNTTLFSIFNAVFLHQISASDPAHLWRVWFAAGNKISYPDFRDLLASKMLPDLAASHGTELNLRIGDDIERVSGEVLTPDFFHVFGIGAAAGRTFTTEEDVVVLSDGCWRRRFGRDPHILGRALNLNARPYTVIGVLPRGYRSVEGFGLAPEFYLPISRFTEGDLNQRGHATLDLFCRLPREMSPQQAVSILTTQSKQLKALYPALHDRMNMSSRLFPLSGLEGFRGTAAPMEILAFVGILFVVVGLVLLIACANVASLLLARGASRHREIAIRLALGATRFRLVRTLLAESLLLSFLSSGFALLLSLWLSALLSAVSLPGSSPMPIELQLNPDFRVLLYAVAAALITALLCGLAPAWRSVEHALACSPRGNIVNRRFTLRNALVVGQVAVSITLLITSFLFLRSLMRIGSVDPGFNVDHLLTAKIRLDRTRYTDEQQSQFYKQALERVAALPGVLSTSLASIVPLVGDRIGGSVDIEEGTSRLRVDVPIDVNLIGPRYFETMAIPLLQGREFTAADGAAAAIVNATFAKRYLAGKNPLGARVKYLNESWREVVGVVADIKFITLGEDPTPVMYKPGGYQIHARTAGPPAALVKAVKQTVADMDHTAAVETKTMRDSMAFAFVPSRIGAVLLGAMGALGLLLVMVGLYGVMSHAVNRRTHEIGIRMALGAQRPLILGMVLRNGLALVAVGVAIGLGAAAVLTRPLSAFLASGVSTADPLTFSGAALLLALVGASASYFPARRASRVDPMVSLRYE
jgi:predicted permease